VSLTLRKVIEGIRENKRIIRENKSKVKYTTISKFVSLTLRKVIEGIGENKKIIGENKSKVKYTTISNGSKRSSHGGWE